MGERQYYRPIVQSDALRPEGAVSLAGGPLWFDRVEIMRRGDVGRLIPARDVPADVLRRLTVPRAPICGLDWTRPRLLGVVNVTPDSFSDGGRFFQASSAVEHGVALAAAGADILDVGGESTRPGAKEVAPEAEIARVVPVIEGLRAAGLRLPISVDTRKAEVARAALDAGADLVNDVSAFAFDPAMAGVVAQSGAPVCLMHARGTPETMQEDPCYDDVVLDVFDELESRIGLAEAAGIARERIVVDPGIGFGKTQAHNLALIRALGLFHGLGCPILLGVSRKRFIGTIGDEPESTRRAPGSVAVGLAGLAQGVQMLRVHDIRETRQAVLLWQAAVGITHIEG